MWARVGAQESRWRSTTQAPTALTTPQTDAHTHTQTDAGTRAHLQGAENPAL
jgi:hypothetical protein